MADIPVNEVVALDAVLDGLDDPTSSEVYSAVESFSDTAIASAAARRALSGGGGGGSVPLNWCQYQLGKPVHNLTSGTPNYVFQPADFTLLEQSGDDFSVEAGTGDASGSGVVVSAAGGDRFGFAIFYTAPGLSHWTKDAGSTRSRYAWVGAQPGPTDSGDPNYRLSFIGCDGIVPLLAVDIFAATTAFGTPAFQVPPGGPVVQYINCKLLDAAAGDALPVDTLDIQLQVWQEA